MRGQSCRDHKQTLEISTHLSRSQCSNHVRGLLCWLPWSAWWRGRWHQQRARHYICQNLHSSRPEIRYHLRGCDNFAGCETVFLDLNLNCSFLIVDGETPYRSGPRPFGPGVSRDGGFSAASPATVAFRIGEYSGYRPGSEPLGQACAAAGQTQPRKIAETRPLQIKSA